MERMEVKLRGRVPKALTGEEKGGARRWPWRWAALGALGFLCGRAVFVPGGERAYAPLGLCLAVAGFDRGGAFYLLWVAGALGGLWGLPFSEWPRYGAAMGLLLLARLWQNGQKKRRGLGFCMALAAVCLFGGAALTGGRGAGLFFYGAEGALAGLLVPVAARGMAAFWQEEAGPLGPEESLCLLALGAAAAVGCAGIGGDFWPLALGMALTLTAGWAGGLGYGAALGTVSGLALLLSGSGFPELWCLLAAAGLLAGALRPLGRWSAVLGLLFGAVLLALLFAREGGATLLSPGVFTGLGVAGALFLALPRKWLRPLFARESAGTGEPVGMEWLRQRLGDYARALGELARLAEPAAEPDDRRLWETLIDRVGEEVCETCGLARYCWQETGALAQQAVRQGMQAVRERGTAQAGDLPPGFVETCAHVPGFVEALNRLARQTEADRVWWGRLAETQGLAAEQLSVTAALLERLSREAEQAGEGLPRLSRELTEALEARGLLARQVEMGRDGAGRLWALVRTPDPAVAEELPKVLRAVTGEGFLPRAQTREESGLYRLLFRQESRYRLSVAMAGCPRTGETVSGDSHCVVELWGGGTVLALSDGMGSGEAAGNESQAAVELLELFLNAGFPLDLAVRLMNSGLYARRRDESFATLDLCYVDTDTGAAQFVKVGAAACYLVRGKKVRALSGAALPLGLCPQSRVESERLTLQEGDLLVLLTDGLAEALEQKRPGEVLRLLRKFNGKTPQDLAEYLLAAAEKRGGGDFADDATVLTARLWEQVG